MLRTLSFSIAIAAAGMFSNLAVAQTGETVSASAKPKVELAAYARNYSSAGCQNCGTSGSAGGYAGAVGGPSTGAFGQVWGGAGNRDCSRFYHYPYVFYPQNFRGNDYYRSSDSMYHRYPPEMQIPVYNKHWHNYYPSQRRYHWGHHFILDVF